MKRIKSTILYGLLVASSGLLVTSCADKLDLSPIDYYGSGSYWKTEAQATAYIDGIHKHLRDAAWQHTITFGELRGGRFITGASSDGMGVSNGDIILQNNRKHVNRTLLPNRSFSFHRTDRWHP